MVRVSLILFFLIFFINPLKGQTNFVLSGNIKDANTGEDLLGATVTVKELSNKGASSNSYGFYSFFIPKGKYHVCYQFIGYEKKIITIDIDCNRKQDVELIPISYELDDIKVRSSRADKNVTSLDMGRVEMIPQHLESIPVIFGEQDILKTMQLMPGVKSAGDGNSGFYVRGGGIDQNLILLDEAPVYSASHLLGFFSVFNAGALKNANLYKGSIPAEFGGRASSVLDIQMKEGNLKNYNTEGSLGLISSKITIEGPFIKDKSSFMISGRRTYADLFLNFSGDNDIRDTYLYFYDLNIKSNYKINNKNRIYLSSYIGRDNFGYKKEFGFDWGSVTATMRWNHIFNDKIFSNTSIIFSNFSYDLFYRNEHDVKICSEIKDFNIKQDFSFYLNPNNTFHFGFNIIKHNVLPGEVGLKDEPTLILPVESISRRRAIEWAAYASNSQSILSFIDIYYGIRFTQFSNIGPGEFYEFGNDGILLATTTVDNAKRYKNYYGFEPRFSAIVLLSKQSSIKASYIRMFQFLHLLTNTTTTMPTDLWLPSSNNVQPQISEQLSLGYFHNFCNNKIETSIEVYYKDLKNQIDYKNGADLFFNSTVESELVFGRGWAYGVELLIRKNIGRLNGWLSYTWSKSMRQFDEIGNGKPFPARQDRTHDFSLVTMFKINPKIDFSATWVYCTGNAVTFPSGRYEIDGKTVGYYTDRNGYRMPDYHRLDLGLVWKIKETRKFESEWVFSVYNAYGRENAYYINFREKEGSPGQTEAVQISLFKAVPSITYRFKF